MSNMKPGKLIFSNPAHPESAFTPVMKNLSEVVAFSTHQPPTNLKAVSDTPKVAVYEGAPDVVVTADNPLIISGSGPVAVEFGTVTIEPMGQIRVFTTADIAINKLIKQ